MLKADLHCHSTCSDGTVSPQHLVTLAKERGLFYLSITDHDSIASYPLALPQALSLGVTLLPGVEFSTSYQGKSVHVLAYAFPPENRPLQKLCDWHRERRIRRVQEILRHLRAQGIDVKESDLNQSAESIGRPHIAQALMKKGIVSSVQQAFKIYLKEGGSCFVPDPAMDLEMTLEIIRQGKGLSVLAHPHLIKNALLLQQLLHLPFDGLECFYGLFGSHEGLRWAQVAKKKKWLITGGSDFHGTIKPDIQLGQSWILEEHMQPLLQHFIRVSSV